MFLIWSIRRAAHVLLTLVATGFFVLCSPEVRAADDGFLDPDKAFQLSARTLPDHRLELSYRIAPGYYLYRERFKFSAPQAMLAPAQVPAGQKHFDNALGQEVETYHDHVVVTLPVSAGPASFTLMATHQGCAEKGLCYPPQPRNLQVSFKAFGAPEDSVRLVGDAPVAASPTEGGVSPATTTSQSLRERLLGQAPAAGDAPASAAPASLGASSRSTSASPLGDDRRMTAALLQGHLFTIISLAFVFGLGLSLTPCVWPMLPILSSIIVGQGRDVSPGRGLALASTYSLGMALVYTTLGVIAGLLGESFTGYLQSPPVLIGFAVLLALLSLSMFGLYELQLPAAWRDRLQARHESLSGGELGGVFAMGVLSALVVSPCVSAPLFGVLLYIGQSHDALLGGIALFTIAAGMSVPLLLIGASAGRVLPHSGAWMELVKRVFGMLLLAVALYLVQPVIPAVAAMLVWAVLAIVTASMLGAFEPVTTPHHAGTARTVKGLGLVLAALGVLELVGAASGGRDPTAPLAQFAARAVGAEAQASEPAFRRVSSLAELDREVAQGGHPAMLDIYADWCVACKELEKTTLADAGVRQRLSGARLLRFDVTANREDDRALLRRFGLFGPPGLIFFDKSGREIADARVVGFQDIAEFGRSLSAAGL